MVDAMFRGAAQFLPNESGLLRQHNTPDDLPGPGEPRRPAHARAKVIRAATPLNAQSAGQTTQALAALSPEAVKAVAGRELAPAEPSSPSGRRDRDRLQRRLEQEFADIPADVIATHLLDAYRFTAQARIQTYRAVLAERYTRSALRAAPQIPGPTASG